MRSFTSLLLASIATAQVLPTTSPKGSQLDNIPILGLGTWQVLTNTSEVIAAAIQNGYRHIDCAYAYGNQPDIGIGIKEGLKRTGLSRKDLWITSKLWNNRHGMEDYAIKETLKQLQLDYLDLWLVHWPLGNSTGQTTFDYVKTYKEMEKLVRPEMGARFIGISNFSPKQVEDVLKVATIKPKVHQIELHPYLPQTEFVETHIRQKIPLMAYAPLGNTNPTYGLAGKRAPGVLSNPIITGIAKARGCTPAQVVLAWNMNRKVIVIPKASQIEHQKENIATIKKCNLTPEDFAKIGNVGVSLRMNANGCKALNFECFEGLKGAILS